MTVKQCVFVSLLLLLGNQKLFAEPLARPASTNEVESLPDPTAKTLKLIQGLNSVALQPTENQKKKPDALTNEIEDPTQMNQNFREALSRIRQNKPGTVAPTAVSAAPALPDIKLLATACNMHEGKNHIMLSVDGKTEMVSINDKITVVKSNRVIEIVILGINKNEVRLKLNPGNEDIILR